MADRAIARSRWIWTIPLAHLPIGLTCALLLALLPPAWNTGLRALLAPCATGAVLFCAANLPIVRLHGVMRPREQRNLLLLGATFIIWGPVLAATTCGGIYGLLHAVTCGIALGLLTLSRAMVLAPVLCLLPAWLCAFPGALTTDANLVVVSTIAVTVWNAAMSLVMILWARDERATSRLDGCCIACGYSLTGLPHDTRCPECGRPALQ